MSDQRQELREAWWGGNRAAGGRPQPVHFVEWEAARRHGYALCGSLIGITKARVETGLAMYPIGTARSARVPVCGPCQRALERRRPSAPVVPIQHGRKRRVTQ